MHLSALCPKLVTRSESEYFHMPQKLLIQFKIKKICLSAILKLPSFPIDDDFHCIISQQKESDDKVDGLQSTSYLYWHRANNARNKLNLNEPRCFECALFARR